MAALIDLGWPLDLRWPWLVAVLGAVVLGLLVLWYLRPARPRDAVLVAHTDRLRTLPRYRSLARRELLAAAVCTTGTLALVTGGVLLAGRPTSVEVTLPDRSARDVELCLDVSASMDRWNEQVVTSFERLASELAGERIGMTIFSGAAVTVLPLTDDYEFVRARLREAATAFRTEDLSYFTGVETVEERASLLGDGLVSCVQRFDDRADDRGRAVVLASDNDPIGRADFSLQEAADHAARHGVVVYGLGTPDLVRARPSAAEEFESAVTSTGGTMAVLREEGGVDRLVQGIQRLERSRLERRPEVTEVDDPAAAFWLASLGFLLLLVGASSGRRS